MRILHIDTGSEMRGGQHQVLLLLNLLARAGEVSTLLAHESGPLFSAAAAAGLPVYSSDARQIWKLSRKAEIVHAHDARAHTLAAICSRCPFVVSRRVAFPVKRSIGSRWKYRRAARFLAVSEFVAQKLEAARIRREKIDVVYDAVGEEYQPVTWDRAKPAVALATGDPEKGRDLIERAEELSSVPVIFSRDLAKDLQNASMFVYITRSEGLGSAALLAMQMGVPVIASRVGGLIEVFEDGVSGIFVANEPQAIARAMDGLRGDAVLPHRLIDAAKARVRACFTPELLVQQTLASYRRALDL